MKIIKVDTPYQGNQTMTKQVVEGKTPNWCVVTESSKLNETFNQWWERKKTEIKEKSDNILGIYLYDVSSVGSIVGDTKSTALHIRFDYIKNK